MAEQVSVTYTEQVKHTQEVEVPAGDSTVEIVLPEAVPQGKKLVITVEVRGQIEDAS
jgi:hypothetical protein